MQDYTAQGGGKTLGLCPKSPNCISTAGLDDDAHYVPAWTCEMDFLLLRCGNNALHPLCVRE